MKKKIKSAVISIVVIAVLLLAILIGVKNGTLDKLTKEMPTLATKQEETEKSTEKSMYYLLTIFNSLLEKSKFKKNFSIHLMNCMKKKSKLLFQVIVHQKKFNYLKIG